MRAFPLISVASVALGFAGCRTAGPEFVRPTTTAPAAFKHATTAPIDPGPVAEGAWWGIFGDPTLDGLVREATAQSPTLTAALARVDEARARAGFVRAETKLLASANGSAQLAGETAEREIPLPGRAVTYRERGDAYRAGLEASYELDLWGRVKRAREGAAAQVAASEADRRAVWLVLTAEVAQAYFNVRTLDAVAAVLTRTAASRGDAVEVLRVRFEAGLTPELDAHRARVELATLEAELSEARRRREQAVNALAVLTGKPPAAFAFAATEEATIKDAPPVPAGLPSELLRRRPDIAASDALLHARTAEVGVADAARFPAIRLTGSAGFESLELGSLLGRPSQFWQMGPTVSVPVLDGGRVRANLAVAEARVAAAQSEYRQRGLVAFREVEDALVDLREQAAQAAAQARAAEAAAAVLQLATVRFERGFVSYLEVVDAQRSVLQIERTRAELAGARRAGTVRLIRALGGGWN